MYLSTIEIENFRSLKHLRVDLRPGLNVLVGRNNTGKTNLLRALRHALGPSASRGDHLWLDEDDFFKEGATKARTETMSITLTFDGLSDDQRAHFFEMIDFDLADLTKSKAIVRFVATWPVGKKHALIHRFGGAESAESPDVAANLLASLPVTFLPALRDAEACLAPGVRSRLALLLRDLAKRRGVETEEGIKAIYRRANAELEDQPLISDTKSSLQDTTRDLAGTDYQSSGIRAADIDFEKILRSLRVLMEGEGAPIGDLDANGLGYNNLLYMAVVLAHLKNPDPEDCPLLLVEEPEAHLHPQLTVLLADYLSNNTPAGRTPQTLLTTHSPTLAASVTPTLVNVLFAESTTGDARCNSVAHAGLDEQEVRELQRMLDVTRATLYFARAAILVEGISEALLLPQLAKRLGIDLAKLHVSVIPICGVGFETFKKLLDPAVLGIPVSIVTDGDPPVSSDGHWSIQTPDSENGSFVVCDRTKKLVEVFAGHATVKVCPSKVTLEYDLAEAGEDNADIMAGVWEAGFKLTPRTFNKDLVAKAGATPELKAMAAWRGICRANPTRSKAEFAHRLTAFLEKTNSHGSCPLSFRIPTYIRHAIEHVIRGATSASRSASL